MEKYRKMVSELLIKTSIKTEEIFDYELSPYKDEYNSIFEFYYEALLGNSHYGIEPCFLYFANDYSVNAAAVKDKGNYIVCIYMGTVNSLIERFKEKQDILNETNNDDFIEFENSLDVSINELMFQNAMHFTFYHEMAHLIQKSDLLNNKIYEHNDHRNNFSLLNHHLELDADQFSSLCIGTHVVQYLKKQFGVNISANQFEKTLIIICSSALFYILSFKTNKFDIYYEENSHPHPVIRITCIIFHIVGYCLQSLEKEGLNLKVEIKKIVNKCLAFSNDISMTKFHENYIEDYNEIAGREALNIIAYIKKMRELDGNDVTLSAYKWNILAKQNENKQIMTIY